MCKLRGSPKIATSTMHERIHVCIYGGYIRGHEQMEDDETEEEREPEERAEQATPIDIKTVEKSRKLSS